MSPILGIWASQGRVTTSYESIETISLNGTQNSITFSNIPSTYKHLQVRGIGRFSRTLDNAGSAVMRLNGDTGSNYSWHRLYGDGASAGSDAATNATFMQSVGIAANANTSGIFGVFIWDILDYADTNKYKTVRSLTGFDNNRTTDAGYVGLCSGSWRSTSAVTSVTLLPNVNDWVQYSHFALYGIKGAA